MLYLLFFCCKSPKTTRHIDFFRSYVDLFFPFVDFSRCLPDKSTQDILVFLRERKSSTLNKYKLLRGKNGKWSKCPIAMRRGFAPTSLTDFLEFSISPIPPAILAVRVMREAR